MIKMSYVTKFSKHLLIKALIWSIIVTPRGKNQENNVIRLTKNYLQSKKLGIMVGSKKIRWEVKGKQKIITNELVT